MTRRRSLQFAVLALALAVLLWCAGPAHGQPAIVTIITSTVADLPAGASTGAVRLVSDGNAADDCITGGGSTYVWCVKTGAGWVAFGDGGGAGGTDDQVASEVPFTPAGDVAATNVQAAIEEVDAEHTVDTDTTCLDAGVACLFAASSTEGGAATSVTEGAVTAHEAALTITESQVSDLVHTTDTDDQTAPEVPYTPTTGADWTDPDPADVGDALDDVVGRVVTLEGAGGSGDVVGPASSTVNRFALYADTSGKLLKELAGLTFDGSDFTLGTGVQLQLPVGDATNPSIEWATGSGIYGGATLGIVNITIAGVAGYTFYNCTGAVACLFSGVVGGPGLMSEASSAINPVILPVREQLTTGLGGAALAPALIVSGLSRITATSTGGTITDVLTITPRATAPASCAIGDVYIDDSGAACTCSATNTWEIMNATGSCT